MPGKYKLMLGLAVLALAALACQTIMGGPDVRYETLRPDVTAVQVIEPSATLQPMEPSPTVMTAEMRLSGSHAYTVTETEVTCELSLSAEEQVRLLEFDGDQLRVWNNNSDGFETYDKVGPQRYLRYNTSDRPIEVEISMEGYMLKVYDVGADVDQDSPCGFFTFSLAD